MEAKCSPSLVAMKTNVEEESGLRNFSSGEILLTSPQEGQQRRSTAVYVVFHMLIVAELTPGARLKGDTHRNTVTVCLAQS